MGHLPLLRRTHHMFTFFKIKSEIIPELGGVTKTFGGDVKDFTHWGAGGGFNGPDHLEPDFGRLHEQVRSHFGHHRYPRYPPQFDYDAPEINPVIREANT